MVNGASQGFSWSLYIARRVSEVTVVQRRTCVIWCVGNLGVMSLDAANMSQTLDEVTTNVDRGSENHEHVLSNGPVTVLGHLLDGTAKETRVAPKTRWRRYWALTSVLRSHRLSRRALEVHLGHLAYVGLTTRRLLFF